MSPAQSRPEAAGVGTAAAAGLLAGLAALLAVSLCGWAPVSLPTGGGWDRVQGLGPHGRLHSTAALTLPGLERTEARLLMLQAEAPGGGPASLGVSFDGAPPQWLQAPMGQPAVLSIPSAGAPGARIAVHPAAGAAPVRLVSLQVPQPWRWTGWPLVAGLLCAGLTFALTRSQGTRLALGFGLVAGAVLGVATIPALAWSNPPTGWILSLTPPLFLLGAAVAVAGRRRPELARGSALLAAAILGTWVRLHFLPSTGSWDTEYWKAWMLRAADRGVTQVYGGPEAVPPGRFLAQMRGTDARWEVEWHGRAFTVDYPPLAMGLWRASWGLVRALHGGDAAEAQSIAVKLPAVLGDVAAVGILLWGLRARRSRALAVAAAYWALPVSWLSSAVLGFLDGAVVPLIAAAVLAAGRGRSAWSGAWLAAACLIKPTAVIAAPAVLVALLAAGGAALPALAAGLAVVGAALLPFAVSGTLATAVVHCYWILFQGTLSGGYPNVWWILGHALAVAQGLAGAGGRVPFVRLDQLPAPARPLGTAAFLGAAAWVAARHWRIPGPGPAALAAAALFFSYGMLAVGVHENHPHPLFLLLALTGLATPRLRILAAGTSTVYVLNMLMLSGLGRFHGHRYLAWEGAVRSLGSLRMAPGFDATLLLAALNVALYGWMMWGLRADLAGLAGDPAAAGGGPRPKSASTRGPGMRASLMDVLDRQACYRILQTRDARFDGRLFVGVTSTGIYCRPVCPAGTTKFENCRFFASAAAAQEAGFRPCLRCRPETAPDLASWRGTSNTVSRALALISEGGLDGGEAGVDALAERLGVGGRQLRRLFQQHLGASPVAVAQTRRVLFAKQLIQETRMPMAEVALAAGFGSVRRFNETFRTLFRRPPSALRRRNLGDVPRGSAAEAGVRLRLRYRPPYDWPAMLSHLEARAIEGVEQVSAGVYRRTVSHDGRLGTVEVRHEPARDNLDVTIRFPCVRSLPAILARVKRVFDVGADIETIGAHLSRDPFLARLVAQRPGLRAPGGWDGFELATRAILGQQVTVTAARRLAGQLVALCGEPLPAADPLAGLSSTFPTPDRVVAADLRRLGMPAARRDALKALARAALADRHLFHTFGTVEEAIARLRSIRGVGEWTAQYIALRALGETDAFPASDIGLLRGAASRAGVRPTPARLLQRAEPWRPWRAYAAQHLWAADALRTSGVRVARRG